MARCRAHTGCRVVAPRASDLRCDPVCSAIATIAPIPADGSSTRPRAVYGTPRVQLRFSVPDILRVRCGAMPSKGVSAIVGIIVVSDASMGGEQSIGFTVQTSYSCRTQPGSHRRTNADAAQRCPHAPHRRLRQACSLSSPCRRISASSGSPARRRQASHRAIHSQPCGAWRASRRRRSRGSWFGRVTGT